MADEITLSYSLSALKSTIMAQALARSVESETIDWAGTTYQYGIQSVLVTATAFDLGSVATCGWAVFHNLDSSNYVKLRNGASGADFIRLLAGQSCVVRLENTCVPYGIADTATVSVEYMLLSP